MKISGDHVGRILGAELRAKDIARATERGAVRTDKVSFSQRAADVQAARRALESVPEVRDAKVAELRKQIEQGSYHVDSKSLAVELLREAILQKRLR
jgi:flagellar biosynthesis anti-sigma factor FlgM